MNIKINRGHWKIRGQLILGENIGEKDKILKVQKQLKMQVWFKI